MKVTVTGSLGHIGRPLTEDLVAKGHSVTVISSKADRQKDIEALGATAAIGSLEDVDFLVSVFKGADAVFAMIPPDLTEADQVAYYDRISSNYARAVQQSGVKHIVHLSSMGAHLDKGTGFILGSHRAEAVLHQLPSVSITHLRPGYFYTNLFNFMGMIRAAGFIGANYGGEDNIVMVHPVDIASAAAEELELTASGNKLRYIGSDELTGNEAARILGAAIGRPELKWVTITNEQMQDGMEKNGVPSYIAAKFVEMGASIHTGVLREDYDRQKPFALGKIRLGDFAKEFAAAFSR